MGNGPAQKLRGVQKHMPNAALQVPFQICRRSLTRLPLEIAVAAAMSRTHQHFDGSRGRRGNMIRVCADRFRFSKRQLRPTTTACYAGHNGCQRRVVHGCPPLKKKKIALRVTFIKRAVLSSELLTASHCFSTGMAGAFLRVSIWRD